MAGDANKGATNIEVQQGMHFESGPDKGPSGASDPVEGVNPREAVLNAIYEKRNQVLESELAAHAAMSGAEETPAAGAQAGDAAQPGHQQAQTATGEGDPAAAGPSDGSGAPSAAAADPEGAAAQPSAKQTFMVGGHPVELSQEEMIRAAEETLRRNREAQMIYGQPVQQQPAAQPSQQQPVRPVFNPNAAQPAAAPVNAGDVIDAETAKNFATKLNYGNEAEQAQAVRDLVSTVVSRVQAQPAQPGMDPRQMINIATQNAIATISYQNTLQEIGAEFQDVFADNLLSIAAGNLTGQLRQKYTLLNQPKSEKELMREALTEVRARYLRPNPTPAQETGNTPANPAPANPPVQAASPAAATQVVGDRIERKRAAPQPPAAANKIASEAAPAQQQTASDVVNWMRKSRHQPVLS